MAHMVNVMNKVPRDYIPDITMPFLDDIPIKGCPVEDKDETLGPDGCRRFVAEHIGDCEKVLQRLESARLTFFGEKSAFGQSEIMVVGHLCGPYGRKPSPAKVEAISVMKEECKSFTEVRRFLGACAFYHIWIPHYAHVTEPLYGLLKKRRKFEWSREHAESVRRLKGALPAAPALPKTVYGKEVPIYGTVDTSLIGIGWVINQEGDDGTKFPIWFTAPLGPRTFSATFHVLLLVPSSAVCGLRPLAATFLLLGLMLPRRPNCRSPQNWCGGSYSDLLLLRSPPCA